MEARPVSPTEREAWDRLARSRGELFQQPEWVDALGSGTERFGVFDKGGCLVAGLVLRRSRKSGLTVWRNAPFSPSVGPFFDLRATSHTGLTRERRKILEAVASAIEPGWGLSLVSLSPDVGDVLPFRWRSFRTTVDFTYRLALERGERELLSRYDAGLRNDLRRAQKDGLVSTVGREFGVVGEVQREALDRDGAGGAAFIPPILAFADQWSGAYTVCVRRGDTVLAACLVFGWGSTAYYVMGGHARSGERGAHHGAGSLALHEAIVHAGRGGYEVFDFEGSSIPRVEAFVRGFAGTLTPYFTVSKAALPVEVLLKLRWRTYF